MLEVSERYSVRANEREMTKRWLLKLSRRGSKVRDGVWVERFTLIGVSSGTLISLRTWA